MAKAKNMKTRKGQTDNRYIDNDCGGLCSRESEHLCQVCADWGELKGREGFTRVESDPRTNP